MDYLVMTVIALCGIINISKRSKRPLHIAQLNRYRTKKYLKFIKKNNIYKIEAQKPDFVMTKRAKRLYIVNLLFNFLIIFVSLLIFNFIFYNYRRLISISIIVTSFLSILLYYIQPLVMLVSVSLMEPIEDSINLSYYKQAQLKRKNLKNLKVVGITGSFGKTSTNIIIGTILSEKYKVLSTNDKVNNTISISKVINDELNENIDVFITEMGARKPGEIKSISDLCSPDIGVITSIGPVHLETFKNIDNIMKANYELIEELPPDGLAVFNYDNEYIKKLSNKTFKAKVNYGLEKNDELDFWVEDIFVCKYGSTFMLKNKEGESIKCMTKLLGRYNILNILAGVSVARAMGLTMEEIKSGIAKINPMKNRLNIFTREDDIIFIDDSANKNPIGTKAALDVLSQFKLGKKIIVTPGILNLGKMEEITNKEFGNSIAKVCDYVVIINSKASDYLYEGIIEKNYNEDNIIKVNSLEEANKKIEKIAESEDVILYENEI